MSLPPILGTEHKELVYSDAEVYDTNAILKILKWLSNKTATLHQTLQESLLQDKDCSTSSDAQLLVMLLRALGLRVRLVMVLNPISFKESKASGKRKSVEGSEKTTAVPEDESGEQLELIVESDALSSKETKSSGTRKHKGNHESKSDNGGEEAHDGSSSKNAKATRKRSRQSTDEGSSSSYSGGQVQKKTRKRSQTTKQQKQHRTSTSSPYFKRQTRSKSKSSSRDMEEDDPSNLEQLMRKLSSGSDSEYVPEKVMPKKRKLSSSFERLGDGGDDDDDDFEQPKKKQRRSSSKLIGTTPAKKLRQAADKKAKAERESKALQSSSKATTWRRKGSKSTKDDDSSQTMEDGSKSQSKTALEEKDLNLTAASNSQSRSSPLESVEIVKSEETACWAEVYLTVASRKEGGTRGEEEKEKAKRWTCVHLPSCSVDQPHLCEKHCTIPLHYVIAIDNGELMFGKACIDGHTYNNVSMETW